MTPPAIVPRRWRVPPPDAASLLRWPADFGPRYTIFVDTEEEFDWSAPFSRAAHGVTALAALPEAHRRMAEAGAALTFFVDYPVVDDQRAVDLLRSMIAGDARAAIGAQLHPWVNPPLDEPLSPAASFAGNLSPDFTAVGAEAWREGGLVELPLTTVFTGALRRRGARLHARLGAIPRARGLFARTGLLSRIPLTPEGVPVAEALEAIAIALGEGASVLNFAFHSPSLVQGNTPYVRDAADLARFWRWWDRVLGELDRRGVRSASLAELLAAAG